MLVVRFQGHAGQVAVASRKRTEIDKVLYNMKRAPGRRDFAERLQLYRLRKARSIGMIAAIWFW